MTHIAIIGGGISGLATAYYLQQYAGDSVRVTILESATRPGGKVTSAHENGFVVEGGPDSFITYKTEATDLCRALGLEDRLMGTNSAKHPTYVWSREKLHPMPEGMMLMTPTMILPFLRSRLISWPGKLRMGMEMFLPSRSTDEDESLASFVRRRLGAEALDKIAAPLMAGIYAADPETLSLQSTFPLFLEMEKKHGSLIRGMMLQKQTRQKKSAQQKSKGAPASMFMTLRGGLQQMIEALVARLHPRTLLLNRSVLAVTRKGEQYRMDLNHGESMLVDEIVFSTPAYVTANLLQAVDSHLASLLHKIRYVSTATVSLAFKRKEVPHPMDGFGFVVPHSEKRRITACSWSSEKFRERAPEEDALIRVFIGGARAEELAEQSDEALVQLARQELRTTMGITATPILAKAYRWHKANPQYEVGHSSLVAEIGDCVTQNAGLHLAGAAYHGAGIPDCIRSGMAVAETIAKKYSLNRCVAV